MSGPVHRQARLHRRLRGAPRQSNLGGGAPPARDCRPRGPRGRL